MDIEKIKDSLCAQLMIEISMQDLNLFEKSTRQIFAEYLDLAYAIGFENGLEFQRRKHANNMNRPVKIMTRFGEEIKIVFSCADAAKYVNRTKSSVIDAIKEKHICGGYKLEYA
jgi:hypothetical protein